MTRSRQRPNRAPRHQARFAAVQAIYQMELGGADAETVSGEFIDHRFGAERGLERPDRELFLGIVRGVPQRQDEIDRAVVGSLSAGWRLSRVDSIVRAILRAAVFELVSGLEVPAHVVIDEYVQIANAFFADDEPNFINAALDRIARTKRAHEFEGPAR
jgi:N utilization substance protein B